MTPKPLLLVDGSSLMQVAVKKAAKVFADAKKKPKKGKSQAKLKSKLKKKRNLPPPRPSPLELGARVWFYTNNAFHLGTISACHKPVGVYDKEWKYAITGDNTSRSVPSLEECKIIPIKVFHMIANDAVRIELAPFYGQLNTQFDEQAVVIYQVLRKGQRRPWCYYVLPTSDLIWKKHTWKGQYGYDQSGVLLNEHVPQLKPVSAAPQEILTYLGLHIYNRKWKHGSNQES